MRLLQSGLAIAAVVVLLSPWWFPQLALLAGRHAGVRIGSASRDGFASFQARDVRARFGDVEVAADGGRAQVLAVVDADGRVRLPGGGEVALGYVGREAFEMERCARARWCAAGPALPALAGVVEALVASRRAPDRRPVAWQIRVERDRALVGEDAVGPGGARTSRGFLELVRDGGAWRVVAPR